MVTAVVLINTRRDQINEVSHALVELKGVSEVYSVAGRYDLVALIRVKGNAELADLITGHMRDLAGIETTETLIAFRAFSEYDLERMFAVGFEA